MQIPTQNGKMKILKLVNLKVSYKFRILNAILNSLVCNMMKVFTRLTSASDFFVPGPQYSQQKCHQIGSTVKLVEQNFHFPIPSRNLM
jgi:hypothetical protein